LRAFRAANVDSTAVGVEAAKAFRGHHTHIDSRQRLPYRAGMDRRLFRLASLAGALATPDRILKGE
jgi:hypothetical protein